MKVWNSVKNSLGAFTFELLAFLVKKLSPNSRRSVARRLGGLFGLLPSHQKQAARTNLTSFLHVNGRDLERMLSLTFQNFGLTLCDFFFPEQTSLDVPDRHIVEQLRKSHGGVLVLTFHMGNWEMGARVMRQWGWPVTAVYQPYENKHFKRVIEKRRPEGVNYIPVGQNAAKEVMAALRRGDMVAMLGDHPFGEEGVSVNLFGHEIRWPKGPILLAARQKSPILIAVIVRTGPSQYKAIVEDPIFPKNTSREGIKNIVQDVANRFGRILEEYPTQWYRFRTFD